MNQVLSKHCMPMILLIQLTVTFMVYIQCTMIKDMIQTLTHAVYWRTSAIQEVVVGETSLTWRALSGVIDLYFFSGPDPKDVIQQYVSEIGLPAMQPYWALGYHQCRWGYDTVESLETVVENFKNLIFLWKPFGQILIIWMDTRISLMIHIDFLLINLENFR